MQRSTRGGDKALRAYSHREPASASALTLASMLEIGHSLQTSEYNNCKTTMISSLSVNAAAAFFAQGEHIFMPNATRISRLGEKSKQSKRCFVQHCVETFCRNAKGNDDHLPSN